jgi:vitamin B12 transporter
VVAGGLAGAFPARALAADGGASGSADAGDGGGPAELAPVEVTGEAEGQDGGPVLRPEEAAPEPGAAAPSTFKTVVPASAGGPGETAGDLAAHAPGVKLRDLGGPGQRQELLLRGASNAQVLVFLDGIRLSPPQGGGFDLSLISRENLARVEVLRGAESARFGSDALGGVVHLITRDPLPGEPRTHLQMVAGSLGTFRLNAERAEVLGPWRYLVALTHAQTAGDFAYVDDNQRQRIRENSDARSEALLAKVGRRLGPVDLTFLGDLLWDHRGVAGSSEFPSATARQDSVRSLLAARGVIDGVGPPGARLKVTLSMRAERISFQDPHPPILTFGSVIDSRTVALVPAAEARYEVPLGKHVILETGVEGRLEQLLDSDAGDPRRGAFDAFVAAEIFTTKRQLVVAPVVRLATLTGFGATVIPALGAVVEPWSGLPALKTNLGRAYRNPSLYELYIILGGIRGNPGLQPEDSLSWDAGLTWHRRLFAAEAAYFRRDVKSTILFLPTSAFLVQAQNFRDLTVQGLESALRLGPLGFLSVEARYTYQDARLNAPPQYLLPGRPAHVGGGAVEVAGRLRVLEHLTSAGPKVRGRLRGSVDAQSSFFLDRFNRLAEEARALVGLLAGVEAGPMRVSFEVRNLLDKRDAVDALQLPIAPRLFFTSLEVQL